MTNDILSFLGDKHKFLQNTFPEHYKEYKSAVDIGLPLMLINKLLIEKKEKILASKYNVSHSEFDVLMSLLTLNKQLSPTELYENMIFSSGGMTKVLKKLEIKNLIKRVPSKEDKRSLLVEMTQQGSKLTIEAFNEIAALTMSIFSTLEKKEQDVFEKILKKLLVQLNS
ncbi:MAG: MarR family transcriptional regulator [Arcobacteraceae bacterium]|nr:MarR family transcriptional regulator [Arcobacteraceae bacterium]